MAHFNQAFPTASGTLVTGGIRHGLREISVPPAPDQNELNAKQRRLSRPNNAEEIRRKGRVRNKKRREKKRKLSREEKRECLLRRVKQNIDNVTLRESKLNRQRKLTIHYWRNWKEERMLRTTSKLTIHQIEKANIHDLVDVRDSKIGEGTFGICVKKLYRGHVVAAKHFKHHSTASDVEKKQ